MSEIIEKDGIAILERILHSTNSLIPNINKNDKTPVWDGEIFVYNYNKDRKRKLPKSDLLGRISVQVKSHDVTKYKRDIRIKKIDLEKFATENGVLYYDIQMLKDDFKIFYYELYNLEIKKILNGNITSNSVVLQFNELDKMDPLKIYNLHKRILSNTQMQVIQNNSYFSVGDVLKENPTANFKFTLDLPHNFTINDLKEGFNEQKPFVCYDCNGINIPVDRLTDNFSILTNKTIRFRFVGEQEKHNMVLIYEDEKLVRLIIDDEVDIKNNPDGNSAKFTYKRSPDLLKRLSVLKLVINMYNNIKIIVEGYEKEFNIFDTGVFPNKKDYEDAVFALDFFTKLKVLKERLNINKQLDLKLLDNRSIHNINLLYKCVIENECVNIGLEYTGPCYMKICNVNVILYSKKYDNNLYMYFDFFDRNNVYICTIEDKKVVSNYFVLTIGYPETNGLLFYNNVDASKLVTDILDMNDEHNEIDYYGMLIQMFLMCLDYYDRVNDLNFLKAAKDINLFVKEKYDDTNTLINFYQVKYREGTLDKTDYENLIKIKNENDTLYDQKAAISILLNNYVEYEFYLSKLEPEVREHFLSYPIVNILPNTTDK